jgi:lipopolysaccharide export system protein LptC
MTSTTAHRQSGNAHQISVSDAARRPGRIDEAFKRARRHSGRVRKLKFVLPLVALAMVVAFVGKSWLATPEGVSVSLGGTAIENGRLVMSDPKLDGFTSDNRPYSMTAARAIQDIGAASSIDLEGISAKLPFNEENWITVVADTGVLDRGANSLDLDSEITVKTDTGVTALLQSAEVDMEAGTLVTDEPVDITFDGTHISAESLAVRDKGSVMIFERRVRVNIDGKRLETASRGDMSSDEN